MVSIFPPALESGDQLRMKSACESRGGVAYYIVKGDYQNEVLCEDGNIRDEWGRLLK